MYYELARILVWTPYGFLYQSASCGRERISFLSYHDQARIKAIIFGETPSEIAGLIKRG
jgi:hypothetical protein